MRTGIFVVELLSFLVVDSHKADGQTTAATAVMETCQLTMRQMKETIDALKYDLQEARQVLAHTIIHVSLRFIS